MRELDTLGIAYHSPALMPFCGSLHSVLSGVVPHPKQRSKRWLSTCYPLDSEEGGSRTCGPDYHVRPFSLHGNDFAMFWLIWLSICIIASF